MSTPSYTPPPGKDPLDPDLGDWVYVYNVIGTVYGEHGKITGVEYTEHIEALIERGFMTLTLPPADGVATPPKGDNSLATLGDVKRVLHEDFGDFSHLTEAELNATYANRVRLHHVEVFDSVFGGLAGAHPDPRWSDESHLTAAGYAQFAARVANARDDTGGHIITGGKVTFLGNSWMVQGGAAWGDAVKARIPSATTVTSGGLGDKSERLLTRFDADVPADSDFVVFNEPGVNDVYQGTTPDAMIANLEQLVKKVHAIGAIPVFIGMVPLVVHPARSTAWRTLSAALIGNGTSFPGMPASAVAVRYPLMSIGTRPTATSIGLGSQAASKVTANNNTGIGDQALRDLVSGSNNTAVGALALMSNVSANFNTAVGQGALIYATSPNNTGIGAYALLGATTGEGNTGFGKSALYAPAGNAANATTTGSFNTAVGVEAGSAPDASRTTAVGHQAVAAGPNSTALGANTSVSATANGGVAIGRDFTGVSAAATVANEFALGTGYHHVRVKGRLNVAPRTPSSSADTQGVVGDITSDDNYIYAKTSTGWKRSALTTF